MKTYTNTQILAFTSAFVLLFSSPLVVLAADSSSFTLYDEVSDIADGSPLGSNSFSLNEAGETWIAYPLTGSNFQIVTAPPAQSSSVATTSSSSSSSSSEETGGGGSGGHRGAGTNKNPPVYTPPSKPSAPDPKPTAPPLPDLPAQVIDPLPGVDFMPSEPEYDIPVYSTDDKRRERVTSRPHFFDTTDSEIAECHCSQLKPAALQIPLAQTPIVSTVMLIVAFILGYIARLSRPGYTSAPKKLTKSKKK